MLEKLFESIDKSIMTDALKKQLSEEFELAVSEKAEEMTNESIQVKVDELDAKCEEFKAQLQEEYDEKLNKLDEQCEEYKSQLDEEYNERIEKLDSLAESYVDSVVEELKSVNEGYMDKCVDEFIDEAKSQLDVDLDVEKCKAINETYANFALLAGVDVMQITEASEKSSFKSKLDEMTERYNDAVNESIEKDAKIAELQALNDKMLKAGVISEVCEGLSLVEKDKFVKSAELVEFTADKSYLDRLNTLKESILGVQVEDHSESVNESAENAKPMNESKKDKNLERLSRFF